MVVLADPRDSRVEFLREALRRASLSDPQIVSYVDLAAGPVREVFAVRPSSILRIDSPGRSPEVQAAMLARGYRAAIEAGWPATPPEQVTRLVSRRGLIFSSRQWYLGFSAVLAEIDAFLAKRTDILTTVDPASAALMFDKSATNILLDKRGVPVPEAVGNPSSYDELLSLMGEAGCTRVFVKPRYGSAASGVVALERSRDRVQAWTTVELIHEGMQTLLFNSRRISRMQEERRIAELIDALCPHGLHVERWVPKAGLKGHRYDLRLLVVAGEPAHGLVRLSKTPITNLHLLNRRASIDVATGKLPTKTWDEVLNTCRHVARLFDRNLQISLDVAISPCWRRHWVLEVNAFGDLLRDCLHRGLNPYELQVAVLYGEPV